MPVARIASFADTLRALGGEAAQLIAGRDWSRTPLGPIEAWPASLRTALGVVLLSPVPMVMLWGEDGIMLYNDAYSIFAGGRHPELLGSKVREGWPEVADFNDHVMKVGLAGGTLAYRDQELTLYRHGRPEQVFMNLDYSPVLDEGGRPAGVLAIVVETTERVAAERRRDAAEAALRTERDRAQGVLDNMGEAFVLLDSEFRIVDLNAEAMRLEQRPRAEILGKTHWEAHPAAAPELGELYRQAMAQRVPVALEHRYVWSDGRDTWIDMRAYPVRDGLAVFYRDVTDRKRAEAAVRESEARLRTMLEIGTVGTVFFDMEGGITEANDAFLRMIDFTRDELQAGLVRYEERTPPDWQWRDVQTIAELKATGQSIPFEKEYFRKDGSRIWIYCASKVLDERTAVEFVVDVTERVRTEAALRESEARYRALIRASASIVWRAAADGAILDAPDWPAFTGQVDPDYKGWGWASMLHPDDLEETARIWRASLDAGTDVEVVYRIRHISGEYRWAHVRGVPMRNRDGTVREWVGTVTDIHDRRQAEAALAAGEARFRSFVEASSQVIWTRAADGRVVEPNPSWPAYTGQSWEEVRGLGFLDAVHPEDRAATLDAWKAALARGDAYDAEYRLRRHDGAWRRMHARGVPVRGSRGEVLEWTGTCVDVTEVRTAEEELQRYREDLERMVAERTRELEEAQARLAHAQRMEALGQLAGGIAHDFNNVLQAVSGGAKLIGAGADDQARVRRLANMVHEAAGRGASVTRRLLAFSRRGDLRAEPVDAASLLTGTQEVLEHTLGAGIRVQLALEPGLPPLLADKGQLETVLVNLAANARDAMNGQGTITLAAAIALVAGDEPGLPARLGPGAYVRLTVSDTGLGMTPEVLARASEPFFTTKPKGKGTGLGLAMARGFAEQSGGALGLESTPGRGTTVSLWLPVAEDEVPALSPTDTGAMAAGGRLAWVLLVDDDAIVREITAEGLRAAGYAVVAVEGANEALDLLDAGEEVDVLVSDLSMPRTDGLALIREAQQRRPELPAVLLTGFATDAAELAMGGALSGAFSLLRKPIDPRTLADRVAVMLEGKSAPSETR